MIDNSQDKGYTTIWIEHVDGAWHICEAAMPGEDGKHPVYVDYENGTIFVVSDGDKSIIGTYETAPTSSYAKVFAYPSNRVIGRVGDEFIFFRRKDEDFSAGRYIPEEECLAYYSERNGSIKAKRLFPYWGTIHGSEIGGAAAFVAVFYNYQFEGVFRDYFAMDDKSFKEKYASYLDIEDLLS